MSKKKARAEKDAPDKAEVRALLSAARLTVESVPTAEEQRCDLRASDSCNRYLVEVKGVHDDDRIRPTLASGNVYTATRQTMYRSKIDERVSEAVAQLMETAKQESEAFRLVALLARTTVGSDITTGQIFGTLYGERGILHVDKNGITLHTGCLYFSRSAFFKNKELDGVLVIDDAGGPCLCVNDYGRRVETFRKSGLAEWFAQHGALNYAERLETVGGFFVVHQVIDPPDPKAALQYVRDRYGLGGCTETHLAEYTAMSTLR